VPYLDYSHWLPVDRAIAVPSQGKGPPMPYTRAVARKAGWQWRIPLRSRVGNGLVYSSAHLDDAEAEEILLGHLDGAPTAPPRRLKFKTGRRQVFWEKNVVSVGLASGFLEPLESTSISLIQSSINRLIALMPDRSFNARLRDEYNRQIEIEFDRIRDFIILHYCLSDRDDSDFWRHVRTMDLPDSLAWRIETFKEAGVVVLLDNETFVAPSWQAIYAGLGVLPQRLDPLMAQQRPEEVRRALAERRRIMGEAVSRLPTQEDFLKRFC
jgi:tryptophan halogenase